MIKPILEQLEPLVVDELYRANLTHPPLHSPHEGLAVIMEEEHEAQCEATQIEENMMALQIAVFHDDFRSANEQVKEMRKHAVMLAAEAIQVAAMCDKWNPYGEVHNGD